MGIDLIIWLVISLPLVRVMELIVPFAPHSWLPRIGLIAAGLPMVVLFILLGIVRMIAEMVMPLSD